MKTLIAVPCMDMVPILFATSLINLRKSEDTSYAVRSNALIYDSRNSFAFRAIEGNFDRLLWIDSDMVFEPDMMEKLSADMDEGKEFVSALAFKRHLPTCPVVYKELTYDDTKTDKARAVSYKDYPKDSVFEIAGAGLGACMMSVDLIKRVWDHYGPPFDPITQMGEDLSFCYRVQLVGGKMWCDSRIKVGHCGQMIYDERVYQQQEVYHG